MRRWLRFSADEWDALPWWQQHMYMQGLTNELNARNGRGGGARNEFVVRGPRASEQLAALGVTVERGP